jgi:hypothetical protein
LAHFSKVAVTGYLSEKTGFMPGVAGCAPYLFYPKEYGVVVAVCKNLPDFLNMSGTLPFMPEFLA